MAPGVQHLWLNVVFSQVFVKSSSTYKISVLQKKMWSFRTAKAPHIFLTKKKKNDSVFTYIWNCYVLITNDLVSVEQMGPDWIKNGIIYYLQPKFCQKCHSYDFELHCSSMAIRRNTHEESNNGQLTWYFFISITRSRATE